MRTYHESPKCPRLAMRTHPWSRIAAGFAWNRFLGLSCAFALLGLFAQGCATTTTVTRDHYPAETRKGYVMISLENKDKEEPLWNIDLCQVVGGEKVFLGDLMSEAAVKRQSTFMYGAGSSAGSYLSIVASAPLGKAMFCVRDNPLIVDVYEAKTTRVTVVYEYLREHSGKWTSAYGVSFKIDDPLKGKSSTPEIDRPKPTSKYAAGGLQFTITGGSSAETADSQKILDRATQGLDLKKEPDRHAFLDRYKSERTAHPQLKNVTIMCPEIPDM